MNDFASNANWYLIQTKPRQEARAQEHLERQQFECFRPLRSAPLDAGRNRRLHEEELFPGYLFIRMDEEHSWYPIRSTRGVCRVVAFGGQPCPVQDALIEQIRQRLAQPAPPDLRFVQGEHVLVRTGDSEVQAIFLCEDGEERAVILLNLLQREQRVVMPRSALSRLPQLAAF
ncbi:transcription/translation regulatory transformer protein RfaH [Pseudomonas sp. HR96]|uniref:transcription/translation regulatory transformer protein RfaH n=1 Tax=Pseudomonas sp. HR96 TaxID=1027966 RepID=UPI002A7555A8|nr:transcription/translation regulatory transformer protein RfaH [Pseudomonas sp. HR96]WPP00342.1 transcription/translation regulatory transformer protein RfaH [Pseudomonas sp. HR96]